MNGKEGKQERRESEWSHSRPPVPRVSRESAHGRLPPTRETVLAQRHHDHQAQPVALLASQQPLQR